MRRILIGIVATLAVVALGVTLYVTLLFDPEDYRPLLAQSVEQATGRRFTVDGELGLDLFPCCAVTLGHATLGNPPGFPEGDFASVGSASLSLKLWPLITRREVRIGRVQLRDLDAGLWLRRDGVANWEFAGTDGAAAEESPPATAPVADEQLLVEGIEIERGRFTYRDEQDPAGYLAENLQLLTGRFRPGEPFDLKLSTKLTDQSDQTIGTLTLNAQAKVDAGFTRVTLAKPVFDIEASGGAIPAKNMVLKLGAAELGIDMTTDTRFDFKNLEGEFDLKSLQALAGDASGSFVAAAAGLTIGESATLLTVPALSADVTVSGSETPGGAVNSVVQLQNLGHDIDAGTTRIGAFKADISGLGGQLSISGAGELAEAGAALTGTLKLAELSPRNVLTILKQPEPKTADAKALTRLAGNAHWALGEASLKLSDIAFTLDDTKLTGQIGVSDFDKPATTFDLQLDRIDLDRYDEPPPANSTAEPDAKAPTPAAGADPAAAEVFPLDLLRDLRLDGRLRVGALKYADVRMNNVDARLRAADGRLRLEPLQAKLYGGSYRGAVTVDARAARPQLRLDQEIVALQIGQALKELFQNDKLTGALTGSIATRASGNTSDELVRSLDGRVSLNLADGAYLGTDLWHEIRLARARIRRDPLPPPPVNPRTKLQAVELIGTIENGVLSTDRLHAQIPFIRMKGTGSINLVDRSMDYRLQAEIFEEPVFEDGTRLKDLTGMSLALTLKGPLDKPEVGVDLKGLVTDLATRKFKDRLLKKLEPDNAPPDPAAPAQEGGETAPPPEKPRDALKRTLRDLLKPQP